MNHRNQNLISAVRSAIPVILLLDMGAFAVYLVGRLHMLQECLQDVLVLFVLLPTVLIAACFLLEKIIVDRERARIAKNIVPITIGRARVVKRPELVERQKSN